MEYPTHSGLMPANWITLAHFSVSAPMKFANSAGELANTGEPKTAIRAPIFGAPRATLISLLSFSTISVGVFFGVPTPTHPLASQPGTQSPTLGMCGGLSDPVAVVPTHP